MSLQLFRSHLADELHNFPETPTSAIQSYAITTATLARRILEYLNINDLTVPDGFEPERLAYKLKTVLDRIIHFRVLNQDAVSFDFPGMPDLVTLYSDKNMRYADRLYIRLTAYLDVVRRLAEDDLLVAHYLLRRTITVLSKAVNASKELEINSREGMHEAVWFRRSVSHLTCDAWHILVKLARANEVEVPAVAVDCYEEYYRGQNNGRLKKYCRFSACRELVEGYGSIWWWSPFTPGKADGCDETYYIFFHEIEPKENGTIRGLAVPLGTFICIFKAFQKQLAGNRSK